MRLLLVEDDLMIGESVLDLLRAEGYAVDWVKDGELANATLAVQTYDLVLLDLGLPKRDGLEVLRHLRACKDRTPVLIATARDALEQRVRGLDMGADDYIVKPYEPDELLARIRALIRRSCGRAEPMYEHLGVSIDPATREVLVDAHPVTLVSREWAILELLASGQADKLQEVSEDGLPAEIFPLVHELNLLFHRVRNAFEAQKNFIADAAHELRSPLSALKLQVDGLRRATDEPTREVAVHRLMAGIDRATRLVEQLLMLARQQAAPVDMDLKKPVHVAKMMQYIVGDLWESANTRQIDIGLIESDDGVIFGHQDALDILVRNLLDNAVKYTPVGGTVNVAVRLVDGHTEITIEDSGPGIPPEDRERVFDRFYRVAGTRSSGSGLGLAIVKTIADMHAALLSMDQSSSLGGLQVTVAFPAGYSCQFHDG